jgi:hypothetical protein
MSKTAELNALADRCEREEPSRELDAAVLIACGHQAVNRGPRMGWEYRPKGFGIWRSMPSPTTSLDAAVTLEPKDAQEICVRKYRNGGHYVRITLASGKPAYSESFALPITEAAARCAAALRARATLEPEGA